MSRRPIIPGIDASPDESRDANGGGTGTMLRQAMSRWSSGVVVLAVRDEDEVVGLTATSFTSVSLDPPLVLVCVSEQSAVLPYVREQARFTVNLLGSGDRGIASRFAQQMPDDPSLFEEGDPVLVRSIASLVCRLEAVHPGGDHRIVVGRVERVVLGRDEPPLLYHDREYRMLC